MVMSMTGYGSNTFSIDGTDITIEIRSVNSRYLDIVTKMPRYFHEYELEMKKVIQRSFSRERIAVYSAVSAQPMTDEMLLDDWQRMDEYAEVLKKINHRYNMKDDISLSMFLNHEEYISIAEKDKTIRSLPTKLLQELN